MDIVPFGWLEINSRPGHKSDLEVYYYRQLCAWHRMRALKLRSPSARSAREGGDLVGWAVGRRRLEPCSDFRGRHRLSETIALHRMHAGGAQEKMLVRRLHPFGCHFHAETAAEADDRMHDRGGIGGFFDRRDEALVDLELVEG